MQFINCRSYEVSALPDLAQFRVQIKRFNLCIYMFDVSLYWFLGIEYQ